MPGGIERWFWIDRVGILLFDATVSTALFLSLVLLAMLGCRQPARRILIARVAVLASLAVLPILALEPFPRFALIDAVVDSELVRASPLGWSSPLTPAPLTPWNASGSAGGRQGATNPLANLMGDAGRWLPRALVLLYLVCAGAGLAWLLLGFGGVYWLIRSARSPTEPSQQIHESLAAGGSTPAARSLLRVSERVQHPVVAGLLRPTILIPESFDPSPDQAEALRLSLLHEMAHVDRLDHWFGAAGILAQTVWFFLPQIWWIRSQLLIDQEFLADRDASKRYGTSAGYASSLLAIAASCRSTTSSRAANPEASWAASGKLGVQTPLFQRVLMLLYCPFTVEARTPHVWSWALRLAVVGLSIVATCLCLRWPNAWAPESRPGFPSAPAVRLRVSRFVAEPQPQSSSPGGRSLPSAMPLVLPPHADLSFEVCTTRAELPFIRIAGYPLAAPLARTAVDSGPAGAAPDEGRGCYRIHLHLDGDTQSLEVDGDTVWVIARPEPTAEWLTIEPGPQGAVEFRDFVVSW
jgi:beta-lactamase regulating signal transducer with metallopeptidase domain